MSFTFDLKKIIRIRAQISDRCSLAYFAMLSRFHSRGPTGYDFGSVKARNFPQMTAKLHQVSNMFETSAILRPQMT